MLKDFLKYQAKTTPNPLGLEIDRANGSYIFDTQGKSYLDFIAGVSALPLGHSHPKVVNALCSQIEKYMHVMVYGEFVQAPAVKLCKELKIPVHEMDIEPYDIYSADEAFFTGTAVEITPITKLDNKLISSGKRGNITYDLQKRFEDIISGKDNKFKHWLTFTKK